MPWIHWRCIRILSAVASGTDVHGPSGLYLRHRVFEGLAETSATPGVLCHADVEALLHERQDLIKAERCVRNKSAAVGIEELDRQEMQLPVDAVTAAAIVG